MALGTLSIVATPIGNMADLTERAVAALREADAVVCEDTRKTGLLLSRLGIHSTLISYHQHSRYQSVEAICRELNAGKRLALVTDAGTPGIADPGNELISAILARYPDAHVEPVPGVSAVIAALSVSGFPADRFLFLGFPPHKKKRKKFFEETAASEYTVVLYESSHRIRKTLFELSLALPPNRLVCVCRELTKKFETMYRGTITQLVATEVPEKGEFVIVLSAV